MEASICGWSMHRISSASRPAAWAALRSVEEAKTSCSETSVLPMTNLQPTAKMSQMVPPLPKGLPGCWSSRRGCPCRRAGISIISPPQKNRDTFRVDLGPAPILHGSFFNRPGRFPHPTRHYIYSYAEYATREKTVWRKRRDSNPRYPFGYASFQDWSHQPLGHSSVA